MWDYVWGIASATATTAFGFATNALGYAPPDFRLARRLLVFATGVLGGTEIVWHIATSSPWWWRAVVGVGIGGLVFVGLPEALRYVAVRKKLVEPSSTAKEPSPTAQQVASPSPTPVSTATPAIALSSRAPVVHNEQHNEGSSGVNVIGPVTINQGAVPGGPVISYHEAGYRRVTRPGQTTLGVKPDETATYAQLRALASEQKWEELIGLCQATQRRVPEWITPWAFEGIAHAQLGRKEKAIGILEVALERMSGDMDYDQLEKALRQDLENIRQNQQAEVPR